jgi:hypothetical protein
MSESFELSRIVARSLKWQCEDANVKIVKNISVKCLGFPFFLFFLCTYNTSGVYICLLLYLAGNNFTNIN